MIKKWDVRRDAMRHPSATKEHYERALDDPYEAVHYTAHQKLHSK